MNIRFSRTLVYAWARNTAAAFLCLSFGVATMAASDDIFTAAHAGNYSRVQTLVFSDARLASATTTGGYTPLHMAARRGHLDIAKFLVANGANVNATNEAGFTPLFLARGFGQRGFATWLESEGGMVFERPRPQEVSTQTVYVYVPAESGTLAQPARKVTSTPTRWRGGRSFGSGYVLDSKQCGECGASADLSAQLGDRCDNCGAVWNQNQYIYR